MTAYHAGCLLLPRVSPEALSALPWSSSEEDDVSLVL